MNLAANDLHEMPLPTHANVAYGEHERQVLDFWRAPASGKRPVVMYLHGGSWQKGDKGEVHNWIDMTALLDAGVSIASVNYRFISQAPELLPPVQAPFRDAARALQFLRSKSDEWHLDNESIGAVGVSSGACSSLWLAYHEDMADTQSTDPIDRESTRLLCVAGVIGQTTLDPQLMKTWTPNSCYGHHAFGIDSFAEFLRRRDDIESWINAYSPYSHVSQGDPPACLFYEDQPAMGEKRGDPVHTANFGIGLQQQCESLGVKCDVVYPGSAKVTFASATEYIMAMLKRSD